MFNKFIIFCIIVVSLSATEIATIDMVFVFEKYYKTLQAEKKLFKYKVELDKQFKYKIEKRQELEKQIQQLNIDVISPILSPTMKAEKSRNLENARIAINNLTQELKNFQATVGDQIKKIIQNGRVEIFNNIKKVVQAYAKDKNFDLVLDASSSIENGNLSKVIYANEKRAITEPILEILNNTHEEEVENLLKEKEKRLAKLRQSENIIIK